MVSQNASGERERDREREREREEGKEGEMKSTHLKGKSHEIEESGSVGSLGSERKFTATVRNSRRISPTEAVRTGNWWRKGANSTCNDPASPIFYFSSHACAGVGGGGTESC